MSRTQRYQATKPSLTSRLLQKVASHTIDRMVSRVRRATNKLRKLPPAPKGDENLRQQYKAREPYCITRPVISDPIPLTRDYDRVRNVTPNRVGPIGPQERNVDGRKLGRHHEALGSHPNLPLQVQELDGREIAMPATVPQIVVENFDSPKASFAERDPDYLYYPGESSGAEMDEVADYDSDLKTQRFSWKQLDDLKISDPADLEEDSEDSEEECSLWEDPSEEPDQDDYYASVHLRGSYLGSILDTTDSLVIELFDENDKLRERASRYKTKYEQMRGEKADLRKAMRQAAQAAVAREEMLLQQLAECRQVQIEEHQRLIWYENKSPRLKRKYAMDLATQRY